MRCNRLEPAGVGARNLGECIALQLRQLHPDTPARDIAIRVALEHLDLARRPAVGAAAAAAALQRRRSGNGARAGALLSSASGRRGQSRAGRIRDPGRIRAPHRSRLDRRDQSGHGAAGPRQSELRQFDLPLPRPRHAAHAAAGGALADAQPRDPQRDLDQGGALHRAAADQFLRIGRGSHGAADPQGCRRGGGDARIDDFTRHHREVHAHAARRVRVPLFLFKPCRGRRWHGNVVHRHPREDQETDFAGESGKSVERQQARGNSVARKAYRWRAAPLPNIAKACRSRRPTNGSERLPARRKCNL